MIAKMRIVQARFGRVRGPARSHLGSQERLKTMQHSRCEFGKEVIHADIPAIHMFGTSSYVEERMPCAKNLQQCPSSDLNASGG